MTYGEDARLLVASAMHPDPDLLNQAFGLVLQAARRLAEEKRASGQSSANLDDLASQVCLEVLGRFKVGLEVLEAICAHYLEPASTRKERELQLTKCIAALRTEETAHNGLSKVVQAIRLAHEAGLPRLRAPTLSGREAGVKLATEVASNTRAIYFASSSDDRDGRIADSLLNSARIVRYATTLVSRKRKTYESGHGDMRRASHPRADVTIQDIGYTFQRRGSAPLAINTRGDLDIKLAEALRSGTQLTFQAAPGIGKTRVNDLWDICRKYQDTLPSPSDATTKPPNLPWSTPGPDLGSAYPRTAVYLGLEADLEAAAFLQAPRGWCTPAAIGVILRMLLPRELWPNIYTRPRLSAPYVAELLRTLNAGSKYLRVTLLAAKALGMLVENRTELTHKWVASTLYFDLFLRGLPSDYRPASERTITRIRNSTEWKDALEIAGQRLGWHMNPRSATITDLNQRYQQASEWATPGKRPNDDTG